MRGRVSVAEGESQAFVQIPCDTKQQVAWAASPTLYAHPVAPKPGATRVGLPEFQTGKGWASPLRHSTVPAYPLLGRTTIHYDFSREETEVCYEKRTADEIARRKPIFQATDPSAYGYVAISRLQPEKHPATLPHSGSAVQIATSNSGAVQIAAPVDNQAGRRVPTIRAASETVKHGLLA